MNSNLEIAKNKLFEGDFTFIALKNNEVVYSSSEKGLKPLLYIFKNNLESLDGASIADKVIGRAAAMFLIESNICDLYAEIISKNALELLEDSKINIMYGKVVKEIRNRDNTDMCPMEKLSMDSDSTSDLIIKIEEFFKNEY